jgi:quercetin dioxygenase-like cupin family protein
MARRGDIVENPMTGERITFLKTARDTGGELLRFEYVLPPGWSVPQHVHPRQEERHEILSGTLRGRVGGQEHDFGEGQVVVGPAGVPHAWRNPSDHEELRLVSELRPALHMEALLETISLVMADLKVDKVGAPKHLLRLAVGAHEAREDFYFTGAPMQAFWALLAALAPIGRLLGHRGSYPECGDTQSSRQGRATASLISRAGLATAGAVVLLVFAVVGRRGKARYGNHQTILTAGPSSRNRTCLSSVMRWVA